MRVIFWRCQNTGTPQSFDGEQLASIESRIQAIDRALVQLKARAHQ
jgi:hypothetical protein